MRLFQNRLSIFVFCCFLQNLPAQPAWVEPSFRSMSPPERYRFVHDFPYWKIKTGSEQTALLKRMFTNTEAENDRCTVLVLKYYICRISRNQGFEMPAGKTCAQLFSEMEEEVKKRGYEVEEVEPTTTWLTSSPIRIN
jgi:hypothetical protein